jgi:hypothetical protein
MRTKISNLLHFIDKINFIERVNKLSVRAAALSHICAGESCAQEKKRLGHPDRPFEASAAAGCAPAALPQFPPAMSATQSC